MTFQTPSWEPRLISWAHEGLRSRERMDLDKISIPDRKSDELEKAFNYCDAVTKKHSRTFYLASSLLNREKRNAVRVLYAFCRVTDDMVDRKEGDVEEKLRRWETLIREPSVDCTDRVVLAWTFIRHCYRIPILYGEQLIEGVKNDLVQNRYNTFDDLVNYCYGVASTVGLMSMHIIGFNNNEAIIYAIKLGIALQLTNILRDVGEDWKLGRLYLPQAELKYFKLSDQDIAAGRVTENWRNFMKFQINRTRKLYEQSIPGIRMLNKDGRFAIASAALLYQGILDDIEKHDYNVFNRRAYISKWDKIYRLPGIWLQSLKKFNSTVLKF